MPRPPIRNGDSSGSASDMEEEALQLARRRPPIRHGDSSGSASDMDAEELAARPPLQVPS